MKGQLNYPPLSKVTDDFISPRNITNNNDYYNNLKEKEEEFYPHRLTNSKNSTVIYKIYNC